MSENEYRDLSVFEAIKNIEQGTIIIPDIQREYCWGPKDIVDLFKSIIEEYPIGSFIIWKVKGDDLNKCSSDFYDFLHSVKRKKDGSFFKLENKLLSKNFENTKTYDVILDGQQRLTSFFLMLKGEYYFKKNGRGHDDKDTNYEEKELYYTYNWDLDIEDADRDEAFKFLTKTEYNPDEYYRVKDLLKYNNEEEYYTAIDELTINMVNKISIRKYLKMLFKRLNNKSQNESLIHYFTINSSDFDKALDVFVRVNSTGKKLNKTDLLFGTLINKWEKDKANSDGRRKEIEKFLNDLNERYIFNFNKDFLLRTCFVLAEDGKSNISMQEISKKNTISCIRNNWDKIKKCFNKCVQTLKDIDLNDEKIVSYNAIIPIIYYLYIGGKFKRNGSSRNELRKYFAILIILSFLVEEISILIYK